MSEQDVIATLDKQIADLEKQIADKKSALEGLSIHPGGRTSKGFAQRQAARRAVVQTELDSLTRELQRLKASRETEARKPVVTPVGPTPKRLSGEELLKAQEEFRKLAPDKAVEALINTLRGFGQVPRVETTRALALTAAMSYIVTGSTLSVLDIGTDFWDFSIGGTIDRIMSVFVDNAIIKPLRDQVDDIARFGSLGANIFVRPRFVEVMDECDMIFQLGKSNFRDSAIRVVLKVNRVLKVEERFNEWKLQNRAIFQEAIAVFVDILRDTRTRLSAIKREIKDIQRDEFDLKRKIRKKDLSDLREVVVAELVSREPKKVGRGK